MVEIQIQTFNNFHDLTNSWFHGTVNAFCWERQLKGDFSEIVRKIRFDGNIKEVDLNELNGLELSENGQLARETLLEDMQLLSDHGASPVLNLIKSYQRDDFFFPTDVYSYHVDHSPVPTSTFLCTYHGTSSDILPNDQAEQKIFITEIRKELMNYYEGPEDGFETFLSEYFFDLHYEATENAQPINLGIGHLWRLAVDHPTSNSLPCIHRAPVEKEGEIRLLLIC